MPIDPSTQSIDMRRIFTGIALAAVLLLALWLRGLPLLFVILLVCALGLWEFYSLFWGSSRVPSRICAIILGWGIVQVGLSFQSHDPSQRSNGFLTLAGGIVITFAKEILNLITG